MTAAVTAAVAAVFAAATAHAATATVTATVTGASYNTCAASECTTSGLVPTLIPVLFLARVAAVPSGRV